MNALSSFVVCLIMLWLWLQFQVIVMHFGECLSMHIDGDRIFLFFNLNNGLSERSIEIRPVWFRVMFNMGQTPTFISATSYSRYLAVAHNFNIWIISLGAAMWFNNLISVPHFLCFWNKSNDSDLFFSALFSTFSTFQLFCYEPQ